jgi:hypothetical protein
MNNWPLTFVVDLKRSNSVKEQVQTLGRLSRLPRHLIVKHEDKLFVEHCHPRWYFPNEIVDMVGAIRQAWNFVAHMDERIEAANLYHWVDILEGNERDSSVRAQDPTAPFTLMDQLQIDDELGAIIAAGHPPTEQEIIETIREVGGTKAQPDDDGNDSEWTNAAQTHVKNVLSDPGYRDRLISLDVPPERIIRPVCQEEPKKADAYSVEELAAFIIKSDDIDNAWASEIRTDQKLRISVSIIKRREDVRLFRQVAKIRQLQKENDQPGILSDLANDIYNDLRDRGLIDYDQYGKVATSVSWATAKLAGLDPKKVPQPCRNNGPLDRPGYHYQFIVPRTRLQIKKLAIALLIRIGAIGALSSIYGEAEEAGSEVG